MRIKKEIMGIKARANKFADRFESKAAKAIAFWTTVCALVAAIPTVITVVIFTYFLVIDLYNISNYVKEFRNAAEYSYFLDMQEVKGLHEEMETIVMYGVELQQTNEGDLWYFTTIMINGNEREIMYSANVKKKGKMVTFNRGTKNEFKAKCHIYIQDMKGKHVWIPDSRQHYHQ